MSLSGESILNDLRSLQWIVAARSYGNTHSSFIGLLTSWWVTLSPESHWFASSATFGRRPNNVGGGQCDALLGEGDDLVGIVEVEGTRGGSTVEKIGNYFAAELSHYKDLKFAILFIYAYEVKGRGDFKAIAKAYSPEIREGICKVSKAYPDKSLIVITLDKELEKSLKGFRTHNLKYFAGRTSLIKGYLYNGGQEKASRVYYP